MAVVVRELTSPGAGAVSVLEVAGEGALEAVCSLTGVGALQIGELRLLRLSEDGEDLDEALCVAVDAERVELHLHGSPVLIARVTAALGGVAPPEDSGDIEEAAWKLLTRARGEVAARILLDQAQGALSRRIEELAALDEDGARAGLEELIERSVAVVPLLSAPRVVLAGPANSGKSTLFNALIGSERAITSDEPGTTRDMLIGYASLGGTVYELIDTAGVRPVEGDGGGEAVEREGQRAAQLLRERVEDGWKPECTLVLAFWDAEEFGLIGSTEWGEAHAERLREHGRLYVNADSTVSGLRFGVNGSPGWSSVLAATLARIPDARHDESAPARSLLDTWDARGEPAQLGLPGSGSDFTVFVHHLGVPALNFSFRGNRGGQYHTRFDDFDHMDRFLDPTWRGHETAARFVCELVSEVSARGRSALDGAEAATSLALRVREAGTEVVDGSRWLGSLQAERLASVLETIAAQFHGGREDPRFYQGLLQEGGLEGRPWYRNPLWAPGMETGYAAETLPDLRLAAGRGPAELDRAVEALESALEAYRDAWRPDPGRSLPREEGAPADL